MEYAVYFSPTGNTKRAILEFASKKAKEFDLSLENLDLNLSSEDILYLGVPSFGGRVPLLALERMKEFKGNNTKAVILTTFGNRAIEDTLLELGDFLKQKGVLVVAALELVASHSIFRNVASTRPDELDYQDYEEFRKQIALALTKNIPAKLPGNFPYKATKPASMVIETLPSCSNCGLCASLCPNQAISKTDNKYIYKERCISCMRCVSICPKQAKVVNETLLKQVYERLAPAFIERKKNKIYLNF